MSNTSLLGSYGGQAGDGNMFRNRIINGNCLVAQRGNISLVNNSINYGGADRIFISPLSFTTATGTITRSALSGTDSGYGQFAVGVTTTGSGTLVFGQRIESLNTVDLYNKTITFSGVCYQNTGSSISVSLSVRKADSIDNFVTTTQIGSTGTVSVPSGVVTPFSLTVTLGGSDAINGLVVSATFPLGAVSSKDFAVSNFQLEAGPVATPFERRPYGMELALCQRYYEKSFNIDTAPANGPNGTSFSSNSGVTVAMAPYRTGAPTSTYPGHVGVRFTVTKRITPVLKKYGNNSGYWWYRTDTSSSAGATWTGSIALISGGTSGFEISNEANNTGTCLMVYGHWDADAEL